MNREITAKTIRLIGPEGEQLGVVDIRDAVNKAKESGLDLVEIAPNADPPVVRIMDFGKFLYEINKKKSAAKKKQRTVTLKEIKMRPGTDIGDYTTKLNKAIAFLEKGNKVKVTVRYKGREIMHHELGVDMLKRVSKDLEAHGTVEAAPKQEGRQIFIVVNPVA